MTVTAQQQKINLSNGKKLRGFRVQNKMSQPTLGSIVGRNFRTISQWELGINSIPESVISKLNKEYHLKLQYAKTSKVTKPISKKTTKKTFASVLKKVREDMKLNQKQFASKFHFVPSHLWNIETGKTERLSYSNLKALSKAGVDLNTLVK